MRGKALHAFMPSLLLVPPPRSMLVNLDDKVQASIHDIFRSFEKLGVRILVLSNDFA